MDVNGPVAEHPGASALLNGGRLYRERAGSSPSHGHLVRQGELEREMSTDIHLGNRAGHPPDERDERIDYLYAALRDLQDRLRVRRYNYDIQHPVDEYASGPGLPAGGQIVVNNVTFSAYVEVQRMWDLPERIERLTYTLPLGTTLAVAKLGDRYIPLYNGVALTSPQPNSIQINSILSQDDDRYLLLNGATGGGYYFGLSGYADEIYGNA